MKQSILFLLGVTYFVGSLYPLQLAAQNQRANRNQESRMLDNLFRPPRNVEANAEQQAKIKALREKLGPDIAPKLVALQGQLSAVYTREQQRTRQKMTRELRDAGKSFAEVQKTVAESLQLTETQNKELAKLRKEQRDVTNPVRQQIIAIFSRSSRDSNNRTRTQRAQPTHANIAYGPHERNVFDLYLIESKASTPLAIYIHGGGFRGGDKGGVSTGLIERCHQAGISVASLNYRLTDSAPFPAQMDDCARALQHLRANAKQWNLDPKRFGCTGGSAGAGISLWLAFHDDLADPKSNDPVARQSTRILAAAVSGAQVAYDPRWIKKYIGGLAHENGALKPFFASVEGQYDSPEADRLFKLASPIRFVTKDDPPVWMIYREPNEDLPENARPGQGIHHPKFGWALKEKMDPLGIECVVKHVTDYEGGKVNVWPRVIMDEEISAFFVKHLKPASPPVGGHQ